MSKRNLARQPKLTARAALPVMVLSDLCYERSISLNGAKVFTDESFLATKRHKKKDVPDRCQFFVRFTCDFLFF